MKTRGGPTSSGQHNSQHKYSKHLLNNYEYYYLKELNGLFFVILFVLYFYILPHLDSLANKNM